LISPGDVKAGIVLQIVQIISERNKPVQEALLLAKKK